jgi:hypothetical protein
MPGAMLILTWVGIIFVKIEDNSQMPGSMLILTWVGIIFVKIEKKFENLGKYNAYRC